MLNPKYHLQQFIKTPVGDGFVKDINIDPVLHYFNYIINISGKEYWFSEKALKEYENSQG
jgi:hypothetical protein